MDDSLIAMVHSPLTGPSTWEPTAEALRAYGFRVLVPSLAEAFDEGPHYPAAAETVAAQIPEVGPEAHITLVAHSGAGALVPAISAAVPHARAAVFVDALLPHPGQTWFDTVPAEMRERQLALAEGGRLPKWSEWFPPETIAELLPDAEQREAFIEELPTLPLAYFEEAAPEAPDWPLPECSYLQLSDAYRDVAAEAERLDWPVRRIEGDHLSIVTRPEPVAEVLSELIPAWR